MKKLFLIITAVVFTFSAKAIETKANYYVMNTGETMNCTEIQFGANSIKAVLESGESVKLAKSDVKAIRANGKYFEKLVVYKNNQKTNNEEFMQFVTTRAGLKLYKYTANIADLNGQKAFNSDGLNAECYVIYKGAEFYNEITELNYPTLFEFFNIKYSEK